MANPDSGNIETQLGNRPPKFKRKAGAPPAKVNERTVNWPGLPGKAQSRDRFAGARKLKIYPASKGL